MLRHLLKSPSLIPYSSCHGRSTNEIQDKAIPTLPSAALSPRGTHRAHCCESSHTFTSNETLGRVISFYNTRVPLQHIDHICVIKVSSHLSQMTAGHYTAGMEEPTSEILPDLRVMHSKCLTRLPQDGLFSCEAGSTEVLACQMWNIQQEP